MRACPSGSYSSVCELLARDTITGRNALLWKAGWVRRSQPFRLRRSRDFVQTVSCLIELFKLNHACVLTVAVTSIQDLQVKKESTPLLLIDLQGRSVWPVDQIDQGRGMTA